MVVPSSAAPLFCVLPTSVPSPPAQLTSLLESVLPVHLPVTSAAAAARGGGSGVRRAGHALSVPACPHYYVDGTADAIVILDTRVLGQRHCGIRRYHDIVI